MPNIDRETIRVLVILGAVLAIIEAILPLFGFPIFHPVFEVGLPALVWRVITGLTIITLAVLLLRDMKTTNRWKMNGSGVLYIILGVLFIIFGALIGGIILLIAGVLAFF